MPQRVKTIQPDTVIDTPNGQLAIVSDQLMEFTMAQLGAVLQVAGGHATIVTERLPTGRPNESVTIGALIEWRSHTNAKQAPENHVQPEQPAQHPEAPPYVPGPFTQTDPPVAQELAAAVMASHQQAAPQPVRANPGAGVLPYQEPEAARYAAQAGPPPDGPAFFDGEDDNAMTGIEGQR